ncbi:MAG TPA: DinB family protein [Frankiaceae bacterium]|jgi:uncharacterized damage-inducible protein DinB|nr:DinB family protein [Frankiaceae bacterium]
MNALETTPRTAEQADLLATLAAHRNFLRGTLRDLSDEQAAATPTVSALCLGGLIKHVAYVEAGWARFIVEGAPGLGSQDQTGYLEHEASFRMESGETVGSLLDAYAAVASETDELVAGLADLDASHPLPQAPWFEPGAHWSARRAVLHIIAETSQHAGHADIIRESIDGAKTMG